MSFRGLPVGLEPTARALRVRRSANRATVNSVGRRCFNTVLTGGFEVETKSIPVYENCCNIS